jgi:hypothetical protein
MLLSALKVVNKWRTGKNSLKVSSSYALPSGDAALLRID